MRQITTGPGVCDMCLRPVLWTITAANRQPMPVDPEPNPRGNQAVFRDVAGRWRSRQLDSDRPTPEHAETLHMPHVATCPRRPRRAARARPGRRAPYGPGAVVVPFRRR